MSGDEMETVARGGEGGSGSPAIPKSLPRDVSEDSGLGDESSRRSSVVSSSSRRPSLLEDFSNENSVPSPAVRLESLLESPGSPQESATVRSSIIGYSSRSLSQGNSVEDEEETLLDRSRDIISQHGVPSPAVISGRSMDHRVTLCQTLDPELPPDDHESLITMEPGMEQLVEPQDSIGNVDLLETSSNENSGPSAAFRLDSILESPGSPQESASVRSPIIEDSSRSPAQGNSMEDEEETLLDRSRDIIPQPGAPSPVVMSGQNLDNPVTPDSELPPNDHESLITMEPEIEQLVEPQDSIDHVDLELTELNFASTITTERYDYEYPFYFNIRYDDLTEAEGVDESEDPSNSISASLPFALNVSEGQLAPQRSSGHETDLFSHSFANIGTPNDFYQFSIISNDSGQFEDITEYTRNYIRARLETRAVINDVPDQYALHLAGVYPEPESPDIPEEDEDDGGGDSPGPGDDPETGTQSAKPGYERKPHREGDFLGDQEPNVDHSASVPPEPSMSSSFVDLLVDFYSDHDDEIPEGRESNGDYSDMTDGSLDDILMSSSVSRASTLETIGEYDITDDLSVDSRLPSTSESDNQSIETTDGDDLSVEEFYR